MIPIFHYALVPGGILVLGASETIARHERLFRPLDRPNRIFVRLNGPSDVPNVYPVADRNARSGVAREAAKRPDPKAHWPKAVAVANRRVLEHFAAPFVVVTAAGEVVHFSSHTGRFLEPAPGSPTTNLFDMARQGWRLELRAALRRCVETGRPVEQERTIVGPDGAATPAVRLIVEPLPISDADKLYMIVFGEAEPPNRRGSAGRGRRDAGDERRASPSWSGKTATCGSNCNPSPRNMRPRSRNSAVPTKNCNRSMRNCNRRTRNWKPPARRSSRSTRNCTPSMGSCRPRWNNSTAATAI